MRSYTKLHQFYGGIDLHARTMYLYVLNQEGGNSRAPEYARRPRPLSQRHRALPGGSRRLGGMHLHLGPGWSIRVPAKGIPFVLVILGHALHMKAIHGGKAKNDRIEAQKIAIL
jgi:hypothetical protein